MTDADHALRALRGPLSDGDREQLALAVVYDAARVLEALAGLRQRFEATGVAIDCELPRVERALARATSARAQLSAAVEEQEAVAEQVADNAAR